MKRDIEFVAGDGVVLRGWLQTPETGIGPFPLVVMTHGFSATKDLFLPAYADIFGAAGLACLVYDHRGFGASDGMPRFEVNPWAQVQDIRDAITFASLQPEVDKKRIGVWGTSFSGAHSIPVAALDKRVKCAVSQVPFISGLGNSRRVFREEEMHEFRRCFDADREARMRGEPPAMIDVFAPRGAFCALPSPEEWEFVDKAGIVGTPAWLNKVTLRSVELMMEYEPGRYIAQISPTPYLMIVVSEDVVTPTDIALEAWARALEPKQLKIVRGGHMEVYGRQFKLGAETARDFLATNLGIQT